MILLRRLLWSLLLLITVGFTVLVFLNKEQFLTRLTHDNSSSGLLDSYGQIPEFTLLDSNNQNVQRQDLEGKVWVADFIFTRCGGQCPILTSVMLKLQQSLPARDDLRWVSVTVDPLWDKPDVLSQYALRYNADTTQWMFLTGDKNHVNDLIQNGFLVGLNSGNATKIEAISHSNRFVLIDRHFQIRGYYVGTDPDEMPRLTEDINKLLETT